MIANDINLDTISSLLIIAKGSLMESFNNTKRNDIPKGTIKIDSR